MLCCSDFTTADPGVETERMHGRVSGHEEAGAHSAAAAPGSGGPADTRDQMQGGQQLLFPAGARDQILGEQHLMFPAGARNEMKLVNTCRFLQLLETKCKVGNICCFLQGLETKCKVSNTAVSCRGSSPNEGGQLLLFPAGARD